MVSSSAALAVAYSSAVNLALLPVEFEVEQLVLHRVEQFGVAIDGRGCTQAPVSRRHPLLPPRHEHRLFDFAIT